MASLDEVLKGETAAEPSAEATAPARDEQGKFAKGEKVEPAALAAPPAVTPPAQPEPKKPESESESGLKAALMAERKKRQLAEQKLAQRAEPEPPMPDPLENPKEYAKTLQAQRIDDKVNMSSFLAKQAHKEDYDSVMEHWDSMVIENPALYQQAVGQEVPCEWAYQYVKKQLFLQKVGDPETYETQLEKRLREKWEAEQAAKPVHQSPTPPPSLASATSSGRVSDPAWSGPRPLSQILKRK